MEFTTLNVVWATAMLAAIVLCESAQGVRKSTRTPYQPRSTHG